MAYRTILIQFTDLDRADRLLDVALPLARRHLAHLIGIVALPPPLIATLGLPDSPAPVLMEDYRRAYIGECERIRALFQQRTGAEGVSAEWMLEDAWASTVETAVLEAAGASDLIVASQPKRGCCRNSAVDIADRLVLGAGRPVLLVPNEGRFGVVGARIAIGWNGRREAARAAFDALPLLIKAQEVRVVTVDDDASAAPTGAQTARLCASLARHGVDCAPIKLTSLDGDTGAALLAYAAGEGADLVVLGCYGHSRLSELVFGGVTRHVLANMSLPVLMAH